LVLILLNGSSRRIGAEYRNRLLTTVALTIAIGLFVVSAYFEIRKALGV